MRRGAILLCLSCAAILSQLFQNCGFQTDNVPAEANTTIPSVDEVPPLSFAELEILREKVWSAKCGPGNEWEVCFSGANIPGYDQPPPFDWDNARDDDWGRSDSRTLSWITSLSDNSASSFMRIDRTVPGFTTFTGHFWRRDEFLLAENGLEATFRIRILPQSHPMGVMFHFKDDVHQFKIHFAPDQISFHPLIGAASAPLATESRVNTSMSTFKIRKEPITGRVRLWANGIAMFGGQALSPGPTGNLWEPITGLQGRIAPQIGLGDNSRTTTDDHPGAFDVDYLYYRRASASALATGREPPRLPIAECNSWQVIRDDQTGSLVNRNINLGALVADVSPLAFARSFEVEVSLVDNGKQNSGFSFDYLDRLGGVNMTIYPDRISAKGAGKPGLSAVARVPGFNGLLSNRIRFARTLEGLYWHVYVNDNPVPVLVDVRSSGFSPSERVLIFGPFVTKAISDLAPDNVVLSREPTGAAAEVRLIRWCP